MIKPRAIRLSSSKGRKLINPNAYSFSELKAECQRLGITNSVEYRNRYKDIDGFPAHPERTYAMEWTSYNDFFDIPEFISYQEMVDLIHPLKFINAKEYKRFIREAKDQTLPFDPQTVYEKDWTNWYRFLGKEEPFKPDYIPKKILCLGRKNYRVYEAS